MKLIDKDALVAEIEKLRKKNDAYDKPSHIADVCYKEILSFLDTLEVKEVDFEKLLEDYGIDTDPFSTQVVSSNGGKIIAKYFFELGLKAQKGE